MNCNLKQPDLALVDLAVLAIFVLRMHTTRYFSASDQNYDIAIRFSDPGFSKRSNNLAIRRHFHVVTLTFDS